MPRRTTAEQDSLAAFRSLPLDAQQRALELVGEVEEEAEPERDEEAFWLKRELDARGWSERYFGRQIGCTAAHAHYLAHGVKGPGPELARRMAEVLGVTEQEVLRAYGKLSPLPDGYDEREEQRLAELYRSLDEGGRGLLVRFAGFLAAEGEGEDAR